MWLYLFNIPNELRLQTAIQMHVLSVFTISQSNLDGIAKIFDQSIETSNLYLFMQGMWGNIQVILYDKFYNKRPVRTNLDWFLSCLGLIRTNCEGSVPKTLSSMYSPFNSTQAHPCHFNFLSIPSRVTQSQLVIFGHIQYNFFVNSEQYIFSHIFIPSLTFFSSIVLMTQLKFAKKVHTSD